MGTHPIFESDFDCLTEFCENECDMMESGSNAENARGSGAMEYSSGGQADRAGSVDGKMNVDIKPQDEVKKDSMDTQGDTLARQLTQYDLTGITPEELQKKTVADITKQNLDIIFIGINPGYHSALTGHHYSGSGNHFWTCLYQSGILSESITSDRDVEVLSNGVGLVNVVSRTTASSQDLSSAEIREGCRRLVDKLQLLQPLIACFNGKSIWESFCREMLPGTYKKREFCFGRQDIAPIGGIKSVFYVMPSSSARCAAFPTSETKLPWFREIKLIKEQLKTEEAEIARKGVAGMKFQNSGTSAFASVNHDVLSPKVYTARRVVDANDVSETRKGKKRPNEDHDHPKTKLKHMDDSIKKETSGQLQATPVQHRLAGGGIAPEMLKDPKENERMERVKRWVNNQDFQRASPEPNLHGEPNDLFHKFLQPQNAMHPLQILQPHHLLHKPELWPALGLTDQRVLDSYNLPGVSSQLASSTSAFQGLSSGLHNALAGANLPTGANLPATAGWPYGALQSPLYRFPTLSQYDWSKALSGGQESGGPRVIPFVPVIPAGLGGSLSGLGSGLSFVLPGQNQSVIYPPGYSPQTNDTNNKQQ